MQILINAHKKRNNKNFYGLANKILPSINRKDFLWENVALATCDDIFFKLD
jgi:hypothetical protein